ncbi:MAG TPA: pyridoxamine 5'-phosphate oxidase family protein [Dongiaceae bacterium]|nr:pyridoxamine 5'-phosphate oxidase family protein [Dongiaceae bacterium]
MTDTPRLEGTLASEGDLRGAYANPAKGGEPGFVHAIDDTHIAFPDRPGNNRLDTLTNIVRQPAVGLLFFLPGVEEMLRINGLATVTTEEALMSRP